jgi:hypothetical protein
LIKSQPVMEALDDAMEICSRIRVFTMRHLTCFSGSQRAN